MGGVEKFIGVLCNLFGDDSVQLFGEFNPGIDINEKDSLVVGKEVFEVKGFKYKKAVKQLVDLAEYRGITYYNKHDIKQFWHAISYLKPYNLNIKMTTDSKGRVYKIKINKREFVRFSTKPYDRNVASVDKIIKYITDTY